MSDRVALQNAIKRNDTAEIDKLLHHYQRRVGIPAHQLLLMKSSEGGGGLLPLHDACRHQLNARALSLILDAAEKHGISQQMIDERSLYGSICLRHACLYDLPTDSFRLLLEFLTKHANIRQLLETKTGSGTTCLHSAGYKNLTLNSLRLAVSFFPTIEVFQRVVGSENDSNDTPVDAARGDRKELLENRKCFEKCRLWLFANHQETFLHSLFPHSLLLTCQALKELKNGLKYSHEHATIMLIALMPSPSKFREAVDETDFSAPMLSYFNVVKTGDKTSDYNHWRKNIRLFREFYEQWPPSERKTASTYEGEGSSSCSVQ